ncbi:EamA/RhaT family transporter [Marinilongibacter aquaticus]|uniref:EamA family transporter n=1 Tax=Marinilongibacter aquaticus TaxID=2975157 RepID=UPI0021BDB4AB|nr:EamA family transporter [Marinilongibacter aquaticus]UBM57892.1 EamA/RhaT family transporter [Marinilongibacter aquaticus]
MFYLIASILLSVLLLVNFRLFPRFDINTSQSIGLNYTVCFVIGFLMMPKGQSFQLDLSAHWVWYCLALGLGFIVTFLLSGFSTQKVGLTATSLANNLSLVIPVLASLLIFDRGKNDYSIYNMLGMGLALLAVALATYRKDKAAAKKKDWLLPLSVFLMYGLTNTTINYLNIHFIPNPEQTIPITLIMVLGALISGWVLVLFRLVQKKEKIEAKNILAAVSLGIPNFLSFYLLFLSLNAFGNSGAFVYPIYNMGVILISAFIGLLFFKEKLSKLNFLGLVLSILSILLIAL